MREVSTLGVNWKWSLYVRVEDKSEAEYEEEEREEERKESEEGGKDAFLSQRWRDCLTKPEAGLACRVGPAGLSMANRTPRYAL